MKSKVCSAKSASKASKKSSAHGNFFEANSIEMTLKTHHQSKRQNQPITSRPIHLLQHELISGLFPSSLKRFKGLKMLTFAVTNCELSPQNIITTNRHH